MVLADLLPDYAVQIFAEVAEMTLRKQWAGDLKDLLTARKMH